MRDVSGYLSKMANAASSQELGDIWRELQQLHQKRLWHQLTNVLLQLVCRPELKKGDGLHELYTNVIADVEIKLNPLSLVMICSPIVENFNKKDDAVQFLEKIGDKVKSDAEAYVLTRVMIGQIQLAHYNNKEKVKELIEEIDGLLDDIQGVGMVHGKYYLMAAELHKLDGDHAEYYRASLRYLGCTDLSTLSQETKVFQAFHLCIAALLGKNIFNFGELLAHPILGSLCNSSQDGWIVELLAAFNAGDVAKYTAMKKEWRRIPDLAANEAVLYEKICLLTLMEMTFRRSSNDRVFTFASISQQTDQPVDRVERLVMKCLAKGLVKGSIDQVAQTVNLIWVQPRVLDKDQVKMLMAKITNLNKSVRFMENMIEKDAEEILTF